MMRHANSLDKLITYCEIAFGCGLFLSEKYLRLKNLSGQYTVYTAKIRKLIQINVEIDENLSI